MKRKQEKRRKNGICKELLQQLSTRSTFCVIHLLFLFTITSFASKFIRINEMNFLCIFYKMFQMILFLFYVQGWRSLLHWKVHACSFLCVRVASLFLLSLPFISYMKMEQILQSLPVLKAKQYTFIFDYCQWNVPSKKENRLEETEQSQLKIHIRVKYE